MNGKEKSSERERRDWIIILIILLFGFLCIILAGQQAIRFPPNWKLNTNMRSNLDPDSEFLANKPVSFFEPFDPSILTQPVWANIFLTPGASVEPRTPPPPTNTPVATATAIPTLFFSPTPVKPTATQTIALATPTNTSPSFPLPPPTRTPTPPVTPLSANLQITVSDGSTTYIVGGSITYTITASNPAGPNSVNGATVTDSFPAVLSNITWTCAVTGGAACPANGTGNLNASVNLPVGSSVTFTVNANVSPAAINNPLANTATVTLPGGISDPNLANNTATDNSTPVFNVNLQVTKSDGVTSYTPGNPVTYSIAVTNTGPANITGATVTDTFPAIITNSIWNCAPAGGATCTAGPVSGNINETVNIPVGGSVTYTATANTNPGATTNLVNTVTVTLPGFYNNTGNNSATDSDSPAPSVDLQLTKTDNSTDYVAGATKTYIIEVYNAGPSNVTGATVTDAFTDLNILPGSMVWTCSGTGGATCTAGPVSGGINDVVNIPAGSRVTYTASVTIIGVPAGNLANTASVSLPGGTTDPNNANNSATDTDTLIIPDLPPPDVGIKDNVFYFLPSGSTLTLGVNLIADGDPDWDLVYYEYSVFPLFDGVWLDWMIIEIGDGSNWYRVFYWGDNLRDTNTNVDYTILTVPVTPPDPEEVDQRPVATADLYGGTGITINIDSIAPPGTYTYIRFFAPPGDVDGGTEIDAYEILPP